MLNNHKAGRARMLAGAGLTAALVAASVAFAGPGMAQGKAEPQRNERVIVIQEHQTEGQGGHADPGAIARRTLSPELSERIANCQDGHQAANIDENQNGQRTRIMVCARGAGGGNSAAALQSARERVAGDTTMSAEIKQRVLAQLDQAIARARGGNN